MADADDYPRFAYEDHPMEAEPGKAPESRTGDRVAKARNWLALSVDALSRLTKEHDRIEGRGVSATALHRYEAGDSLPGARELRLLSDALEVPSDWLLFGVASLGGVRRDERELLEALRRVVSRQAKEVDREFYDEALQSATAAQRRAALERARKRPSGDSG